MTPQAVLSRRVEARVACVCLYMSWHVFALRRIVLALRHTCASVVSVSVSKPYSGA